MLVGGTVMSLNINNSNQSANHNHIAFKAKLHTDIPIKDVKRFTQIQKMFSNETKDCAKDKLILTMSKDPFFKNEQILTTGEPGADDFKYSHLISNFDKLMDTMPNKKIVKKLVNYFKMMKKEKEYDSYHTGINKTVTHLKAMEKQNLNRAEICKNKGKDALASQFQTIAESNKKKLAAVEIKKAKETSKIIKEMNIIAKREPELAHVPEIYTDPYFS